MNDPDGRFVTDQVVPDAGTAATTPPGPVTRPISSRPRTGSAMK